MSLVYNSVLQALLSHRNQVKAALVRRQLPHGHWWSVSYEDQQDMKTNRRKGRSPNMDAEDSLEDSQSYVKPAWWEIAVFRFLNAIMVVFFLTAVVKLQSDDNSCLWTPTFLVPAILSTIVAVKPQLSGETRLAVNV